MRGTPASTSAARWTVALLLVGVGSSVGAEPPATDGSAFGGGEPEKASGAEELCTRHARFPERIELRPGSEALRNLVGELSTRAGMDEAPGLYAAEVDTVGPALAGERRVLVYDPGLLRRVGRRAGRPGLAVLLGHALAHHLHGDESGRAETSRRQELRADYATGVLLAELGASSCVAFRAMRGAVRAADPPEGTRPDVEERLAAFARGWREGRRSAGADADGWSGPPASPRAGEEGSDTPGGDGPDGRDAPEGRPGGPSGSEAPGDEEEPTTEERSGESSDGDEPRTRSPSGESSDDESPSARAPKGAFDRPASASRIYEQASPQVVFVSASTPEGESSRAGTGTIVDPRGLVLTNRHVVAGDEGKVERVTIYLKPDAITGKLRKDLRNPLRARVVATHPGWDLALLRVPNLPDDASAMPISFETARPGDRTVVIGHPQAGGPWSLSTGVVSNHYTNFEGEEGWHVYQMQTPVNSGNSGGPLINTRGEMIGVVFGTVKIGPDGLPVSDIHYALTTEVVGAFVDGVTARLRGDAPEAADERLRVAEDASDETTQALASLRGHVPGTRRENRPSGDRRMAEADEEADAPGSATSDEDAPAARATTEPEAGGRSEGVEPVATLRFQQRARDGADAAGSDGDGGSAGSAGAEPDPGDDRGSGERSADGSSETTEGSEGASSAGEEDEADDAGTRGFAQELEEDYEQTDRPWEMDDLQAVVEDAEEAAEESFEELDRETD